VKKITTDSLQSHDSNTRDSLYGVDSPAGASLPESPFCRDEDDTNMSFPDSSVTGSQPATRPDSVTSQLVAGAREAETAAVSEQDPELRLAMSLIQQDPNTPRADTPTSDSPPKKIKLDD
jgi:hypothetical protein